MTETKWAIQSGDIKIHGVLNTGKQKNKRAVLYVHGLSGHAYEVAATAMATQFPKKGYDVIRIFLYHGEEGARKISDTTLAIHGQDITKVVQRFRKQYEQIFACGHSYGVPSLLFAKTNLLSGLAFWDGTVVPGYKTMFDDETFGPHFTVSGGRVYNWGTEYFFGNAMLEESRTLDANAMKKITQKVKVPTLVVEAAKGYWIRQQDKYMEWLTCEKKNVIIPNTMHCFHEEGTTQPLLRATKAWFDKF